MNGKRVLLIISGGIAAYKALELIRLLRRQGCGVTCVLTDNGRQFVTPLSLQALSESKVYSDLFSLTDESEMGHIQLSRAADLLVVAPATANILAKMAAGLADDLASTVLLAADKPVLVAPAMNVRMWLHPATQANMATLAQRGVQVVQPTEGAMACNEFGPGRLAEPPDILAAIEKILASMSGPLTGRHALVTSGPTHEPIDPVRYIANRSSGRQGHAIAAALAELGARVTLVCGPVNVPDPAGVAVRHIETAREMLDACQTALPADIAVFAAAVADWRAEQAATGKIKKQPGAAPPSLSLVQNPDILATIAAAGPNRPRLVIGFAAETDDLLANAQGKLRRKNADWIVANDVSPETGIMGGAENTVHIISAAGIETWPRLAKVDVARRLARRIAETFGLTGDVAWLIRPLRQSDLPLYRNLRLEALRQHPEAFGSSFEEEQDSDLSRMIGDRPSVTLGSFVGDDLVGMMGLVVSPRLKQRHKGHIVAVYVAPPWRRTGLARALLDRLILEARSSGLILLTLSVIAGNAAARRLYLQAGFTVYGQEPLSLRVGADILDEELMALRLD